MSPVVGIDLGTTNSVVAFMEAGSPVVIPNAEGKRTTPSVVHYGATPEDIVVGDLAKRLLVADPARTIRSIKRLMGRRYSEIGSERTMLGYNIQPDDKDDISIFVGNARMNPEVVSAQILKSIKASAEAYLNDEVTQAVITVPAYFNDTQRQATKVAGELAGLEVLRVINEPTAACLAYGIDKKKPAKIAVFDLGGGTFDISLLEMEEGVFEVKSTCGDNTLGGDNFDSAVAEYIRREIQKQSGFDVINDPQGWQRVIETAENAKCELSSIDVTTISLPFIGMVDRQPVHFNHDLSREQLEEIVRTELARITGPCEQALQDAGWNPREVDVVLMVGGSTRMPAVRRIARDIFKRELDTSVNPEEAVAAGAAIMAGVLTGALAEVLLLDVTPLSLGVASQGNIFNVLIPRNSQIPCEAAKAFTTTRDFQRSVRINVYQGERRVASENRLLSAFRLENITPAPKGVPHVNVAFRIDTNGILEVRATDISTGAQQEVRIESFLATAEESERMMKAAEAMLAQDIAQVQSSAMRIKCARFQEAIQTLIDENPNIDKSELKEMKEAMVRIDVGIHLGNGDMVDQNMRKLAELADRQGDTWLAIRVRFNIDEQGAI